MVKRRYNQVLTAGLLLFILLLSTDIYAQLPIDELIEKYKKSPKKGIEMFSMTDTDRDEMVSILASYSAYNPTALSASYYRSLIDSKTISCIGADAEKFYSEAVEFFDAKEGYTTSRSRMGSMRSKGYTLITENSDGTKTKETNTVMYVLPDEDSANGEYRAVVMTIVTKE